MIEAEWDNTQRARARNNRVMAVLGIFGIGATATPLMILARAVIGGDWAYLVFFGFMTLFGIPSVYGVLHQTEKREKRWDDDLRRLNQELVDALALAEAKAKESEKWAAQQQFQARMANALDMVDSEPEAIAAIGGSLTDVLPAHTSEILLADHSRAHLIRMIRVGPAAAEAGCGVDSPDRCPATRRTQTQVFADSRSFDACPKLQAREGDPVSALCVPVSIMGRAVGVLHSTAPLDDPVAESDNEALVTLAKIAGSRIGMLRAMAETQLQAATDSLTGLLNRRSFEQHVADVRAIRMPIAVCMADLDRFKSLNDTYGHETGDRALRLFARVLRESLRNDDLVARHGGEEFAVAFPGCTVDGARRALDGVRNRLDAAITVNGLPLFTCSFGVTDLRLEEDLPSCLRRADHALFAAKRGGRNRVVVERKDSIVDHEPAPEVGSSSTFGELADQSSLGTENPDGSLRGAQTPTA